MLSGRVGGFRLARSGVIASIALLAMLLAPSGALAATTPLGSATGVYTCGGQFNLVQITSPAATSYVVPAGGGTITSWSTLAGGYTGPVALQVWRRTGGIYLLVGQSPLQTLSGAAAITFTLAATDRIPVLGGEFLGLRIDAPAATAAAALCMADATGGSVGFALGSNPTSGATLTFTPQGAVQLNVSATVETGTPPPPPPPPPANGCDSSADANMSDACNQTLIPRIVAAALRASKH